MTDASSDDFVNGLKEQFGEPGHDNVAPDGPDVGRRLAATRRDQRYGRRLGQGALSNRPPKRPGLDPQRSSRKARSLNWAKEKDPDYPVVGEAPGDTAAEKRRARAACPTGRRPWRRPRSFRMAGARGLGKRAQNAWKGAVGGAPKPTSKPRAATKPGAGSARGAAEGAGTTVGLTAAQAGLRALPHWAMPAAIAAGELAHGHFMPWHIRHAIAAGLGGVAARAAEYRPGSSAQAARRRRKRQETNPVAANKNRPEPF